MLCAAWVAGLLASGATTSPKHYVFFGLERERIHEAAFLETSSFEGAQLKYTWRELEPERDQYRLQPLLDDCAFLEQHGKKLWVQLQDVSFDDARPYPDYLSKDPAFGGGGAQKYDVQRGADIPEGWVARRWEPKVQERFAKLLNALAKALDGRLEGLNLAETSIDFGEKPAHHPAGFSPQAYAKAVQDTMTVARAAFTKSHVLIYANFMPGEWLPWEDHGYLRGVYEHSAAIGVGVGGPDLLPHRKGQQNHALRLIAARPTGVIAALAVQDGNLADRDPLTKRRVTAQELFAFARDPLHLDYVFWGTEEPYFTQQIVPLVRALDAQGKRSAPDAGAQLP